MLAALAGVIQTARLSAADPSFVGNLIELSAITAVVVGGTPAVGRTRPHRRDVGRGHADATDRRNAHPHNLPDSATRMVQAVIILAAVFIQRDRSA